MYILLGASFSLAAFLAVDLLVGTWTAAVVTALRGRAEGWSPGQRRRVFALSRVLPALVAVMAAVLVAAGYFEYEPRDVRESVGATLIALSFVSAALLLIGPLRALAAWRATRRIEARWLRAADRIDVAAMGMPVWRVREGADGLWMSGLVRPRVIVGARVLEALTAPELAAALRHELAHASGYDNLVRLCLTAAPGLFSILPHGRMLERQWSRAAEAAADSEAAAGARATALDLASALLKVARLRPPATLRAASAVDEGDVGARIHELLEEGPRHRLASRLAEMSTLAALLIPLVAIAALGTDATVAGFVHSLAEQLVRRP